jgi:hypothetical protein
MMTNLNKRTLLTLVGNLQMTMHKVLSLPHKSVLRLFLKKKTINFYLKLIKKNSLMCLSNWLIFKSIMEENQHCWIPRSMFLISYNYLSLFKIISKYQHKIYKTFRWALVGTNPSENLFLSNRFNSKTSKLNNISHRLLSKHRCLENQVTKAHLFQD